METSEQQPFLLSEKKGVYVASPERHEPATTQSARLGQAALPLASCESQDGEDGTLTGWTLLARAKKMGSCKVKGF